MPTPRVDRRLTAILAVDVAGYSRLMGADEEGTFCRHGRRTAYESFDPAAMCSIHKGRLTSGSSFVTMSPGRFRAAKAA